ncbi:hypothetical protein [Variovorax saccharolyticus]|uniref:hypothetical protein n=1 Tax=Variovorax saccharolyticus TaxID=3053516 RepID=UPI0025750457|nr:hypothetical protein [Variovorax sp. J31P216]MDM0029878.1 hypothetical protein [Variovorax sp. J31P216]
MTLNASFLVLPRSYAQQAHRGDFDPPEIHDEPVGAEALNLTTRRSDHEDAPHLHERPVEGQALPLNARLSAHDHIEVHGGPIEEDALPLTARTERGPLMHVRTTLEKSWPLHPGDDSFPEAPGVPLNVARKLNRPKESLEAARSEETRKGAERLLEHDRASFGSMSKSVSKSEKGFYDKGFFEPSLDIEQLNLKVSQRVDGLPALVPPLSLQALQRHFLDPLPTENDPSRLRKILGEGFVKPNDQLYQAILSWTSEKNMSKKPDQDLASREIGGEVVVETHETASQLLKLFADRPELRAGFMGFAVNRLTNSQNAGLDAFFKADPKWASDKASIAARLEVQAMERKNNVEHRT